VPVGRVLRWLIALGVTAGGFAVVFWIAAALGGLDRATALTLAIGAAPLLAGPFGWWASQPIEPRPDRLHAESRPETGPRSSAGGVFVCYSQSDASVYAGQLAAHLEASGVPAWLDKEIVTGQRWSQVIESQLDRCSAVVVVMTPAGSRSEWVDREIAHARAAGKPILPVLRAGRPFFSLANLQYEDVTDGSMPGTGFVSRLRSVTGAATASQPAVPPPPSAPSAVAPAAAPVLAAAERRPRGRILVAAALASVVVAGVVTAIVLASPGKKDRGTSGSGGSPYAFTAPGLAISPDGQWLYVTVNQLPSGKLSSYLVAVDTKTRAVSDRFVWAPGAGDSVISPDGNQLYVASRYSGDYLAIILQLGANPVGIGGIDLPVDPSPQGGPAPASPSPREMSRMETGTSP